MKKVSDLTYHDVDTPRYQRAKRFSQMMISIMSDFLPRHRDFDRVLHDHLFEVGYNGNFEIINVPPECDALNKLELEWRAIEVASRRLTIPLDEPK